VAERHEIGKHHELFRRHSILAWHEQGPSGREGA